MNVFVKRLLVIYFSISFLGCTNDLEYNEISVLPLSSLVYTEDSPTAKLELSYTESDEIVFTDDRRTEQCPNAGDNFVSWTYFDDRENHRTLGIGIGSKISADQFENNEQLLVNSNDFINHLRMELGQRKNDLFCDVSEENNFFYFFYRENLEDSEIDWISYRSSFGTIEVIRNDLEVVLYKDLGYVLMNLELNFTAELLGDERPANLKFSHALRFPEIDR